LAHLTIRCRAALIGRSATLDKAELKAQKRAGPPSGGGSANGHS
jgi:hypothetical protein